jgi:hypothetical protein
MLMDLDPAVAGALAGNDMTAVPDETGQLIYVWHTPTGLSLERAVYPDMLNTGHAIDALLGEARKAGWAGSGSNRGRAD